MRHGRVVLDAAPRDVSSEEVMEIYRGVVR
jgi:hypothetical protein